MGRQFLPTFPRTNYRHFWHGNQGYTRIVARESRESSAFTQVQPPRTPPRVDREMCLRRVLGHVNGDDILEAVATLGADASYEDSGELLRLLSTRMALDGDRSDSADRWAPTPEAMRRLIERFGGKVESTPIRQDAVFVSLSAMACAMESPEAPTMHAGSLFHAARQTIERNKSSSNFWSVVER